MRQITHIFFDLHSTLIDGTALHPCYKVVYGQLMAQRYGQTAQVWEDANHTIALDWDSYYYDLDLGGEDGIEHMWEGLYRTTRAMFRIVGVKEPPYHELKALSREIPGIVPKFCDATYVEVKSIVERLYQQDYILGVASHALVKQAMATLDGGGIGRYFSDLFFGPDLTGRYLKDAYFFAYIMRAVHVKPEQCLLVDDDKDAILAAKSTGMRAIQIRRKDNIPEAVDADHIICCDLHALVDLLGC